MDVHPRVADQEHLGGVHARLLLSRQTYPESSEPSRSRSRCQRISGWARIQRWSRTTPKVCQRLAVCPCVRTPMHWSTS